MLNGWMGGEVSFPQALRVAFLHLVLTFSLSQGNHSPSENLSLLINELDELHHATHVCRKCFSQPALLSLKSKSLHGGGGLSGFLGVSRPVQTISPPSCFRMNAGPMGRGGRVRTEKHSLMCLPYGLHLPLLPRLVQGSNEMYREALSSFFFCSF